MFQPCSRAYCTDRVGIVSTGHCGCVAVARVLDQQRVCVQRQGVKKAVAIVLHDSGIHDDRAAKAVRRIQYHHLPDKFLETHIEVRAGPRPAAVDNRLRL